MNPADDDFESTHYRDIIGNFLYERCVESEDVDEETGDLLDILMLNGWEITALPEPEPIKDLRPHSRACGWKKHDHGHACSSNCPTCGGINVK